MQRLSCRLRLRFQPQSVVVVTEFAVAGGDSMDKAAEIVYETVLLVLHVYQPGQGLMPGVTSHAWIAPSVLKQLNAVHRILPVTIGMPSPLAAENNLIEALQIKLFSLSN